MTELFEDNQRDLEQATEQLSELLEHRQIEPATLAELRKSITNQTAYVQKRHDILLDDTLRGYLEVSALSRRRMARDDTQHRWEFSVDV